MTHDCQCLGMWPTVNECTLPVARVTVSLYIPSPVPVIAVTVTAAVRVRAVPAVPAPCWVRSLPAFARLPLLLALGTTAPARGRAVRLARVPSARHDPS